MINVVNPVDSESRKAYAHEHFELRKHKGLSEEEAYNSLFKEHKSKAAKKMERWLYNHPWFGKFLTNWTQKRVFPQKGKYAMVAVMLSDLVT